MRWVVVGCIAAVAASGCLSVEGSPSVPVEPVVAEWDPQVHEALLLSDLYPGILVEVAAVHGRAPDPSALDALRKALQDVAGKTQVDVVATVPLQAQDRELSDADLVALHQRTARVIDPDRHAVGGTAFLHILYLDGHLARDGEGHSTLGTYIADEGLIAIFPDEYEGAYRYGEDRSIEPAQGEMDRYVLLHELGHAFGLVGQRIPMVRDHADSDHLGHSRNPSSVLRANPPMTAQRVVYGPVVAGFDGDDLADVRAFQAG